MIELKGISPQHRDVGVPELTIQYFDEPGKSRFTRIIVPRGWTEHTGALLRANDGSSVTATGDGVRHITVETYHHAPDAPAARDTVVQAAKVAIDLSTPWGLMPS